MSTTSYCIGAYVVLLSAVSRNRLFDFLAFDFEPGDREAKLCKHQHASHGDDGSNYPEDEGIADTVGALHDRRWCAENPSSYTKDSEYSAVRLVRDDGLTNHSVDNDKY